MRRMHRRTFLGAALGAGLLTGCGFHLRGEMQMAFRSAYISGYEHHRIVSDLRRQLRLNNVEVVDTPQAADLVISMSEMSPTRDILSLDASGKAREYRLSYTLNYSLDKPTGETVRIPARITARREYTFDTRQLLAKAEEESILYRDMEDDLVRQLMRRLSTVTPEELK